jgi:hypothetical protein
MSKWLGCPTVACKNDRCHDGCARLRDLRGAVVDYLSEFDNPVPDGLYRRVLRERMRELSGAPAAPVRSER